MVRTFVGIAGRVGWRAAAQPDGHFAHCRAAPSADLAASPRVLAQRRRIDAAFGPALQRQPASPTEVRDNELLIMLAELETAAKLAGAPGARADDKLTASLLLQRLGALGAVASGSDPSAQAELSSALRRELEPAGAAPTNPKPAPGGIIQAADGLTLLGGAALVLGLGYLVKRAYEAIRDRREEAVFEQYLRTGEIAAQPIPDELGAGIAVLPAVATKADRLFRNINDFRFRYTGGFVSPRVAFQVHMGDCQTLVGMYQEVAAAMAIPFAVGHQVGPQLVAPRAIHGRSEQSNTEEGSAWYFQEHFWAVGAGTAYDVLFMSSPPPPAMLSNGHAAHNRVSWDSFPDGRCVIGAGQPSLNYQIQGQGRVFANAGAAIAFINSHP